MKRNFSKAEVIELIPPALIEKLPLEENHKVDTFAPVDLLTPERFDVMAAVINGKNHLLGTAQNWSQKIYNDCKSVFEEDENTPLYGYSSKKGLSHFYEILSQYKTDLFIEAKNYLPVNQDNLVIDSANHFAASLLCNRSIKAIQFKYPPVNYDYKYFLDRGLDRDIVDSMALTFARICPNMMVVVVFPIASGKDEEINDILCEYGRIAYKKEVSFTKFGQYNLIQLLYFNMHWIDPEGGINYGVRHHVDHRFWKDNLVKFLFVIFDDLTKTLEVKTRLRDLFDLKNFSLHINDTHRETIWIAEHVLTRTCQFFMNHAQPWLCKNFLKNIRRLKQEIKESGIDKERICLLGSSMLAAYGLRDSKQMNFVHLDRKLSSNLDPRIYLGDSGFSIGNNSVGDLIFDPRNHFYYYGFKIISPRMFHRILSKESKSRKVIGLIDSLENESLNIRSVWRRLRFLVKISYVKISHFNLGQIKRMVPEPIRIAAKKIFQILFSRDLEE